MEPQSEKKTSTMRTYLNALNTISGLGMLSISFALAQSGWASLVLFFSVAGGLFFTSLLLHRCMTDPRIRSYPDIGQLAFGRKGRITIAIFIYMELYLVLVELLILEGDNMHKLFPGVIINMGRMTVSGKQFFTVLPALVLLPLTWSRSLSLLSYVSLNGILSSFLLLITVFFVGVSGGVGFGEKGVAWNLGGVPISMSLYTFCYSAHSVFPTLSNSMKNGRQFPKVLLVCFGVSTLLYGSIAVVGYRMFGQGVLSQITLNLPQHQLSSKVALFTTVLTPLTKYPILIFPIYLAIEEALHPQINISRSRSILIRTGLVIGTVVLALTVPFFGEVMGFIGAFMNINISVLFPCACYLKITKGYKTISAELIFIGFIVIVGIGVLVSGTYASIAGIVKHMK